VKAKCGPLAKLSGSSIDVTSLEEELDCHLFLVPSKHLERVLINLVANGM
jgi:hypothetical protein